MPRLCRRDRHLEPRVQVGHFVKGFEHVREGHAFPSFNPQPECHKHWFREYMVKSRTLQGQLVEQRLKSLVRRQALHSCHLSYA
jgi:hypothetical protein